MHELRLGPGHGPVFADARRDRGKSVLVVPQARKTDPARRVRGCGERIRIIGWFDQPGLVATSEWLVEKGGEDATSANFMLPEDHFAVDEGGARVETRPSADQDDFAAGRDACADAVIVRRTAERGELRREAEEADEDGEHDEAERAAQLVADDRPDAVDEGPDAPALAVLEIRVIVGHDAEVEARRADQGVLDALLAALAIAEPAGWAHGGRRRRGVVHAASPVNAKRRAWDRGPRVSRRAGWLGRRRGSGPAGPG